MPPQRLPPELWMDILKNYISDYSELCNIASTSKLIRGFALPVLFHRLTFDCWVPQRDSDTGRVRLAHKNLRAGALQVHRHLSCHVREIHLKFWSPLDEERSPWTEETLINLLLAFPHIRRLEMRNCHIAARLQKFIHQHSGLKSLELTHCEAPDARRDLDGYRPLRLEEFLYSRWNKTGPFHISLFEHSMSSLTSLAIPIGQVPSILLVCGDHLLCLRSLVLYPGILVGDNAAVVCKLLDSCPELRTLDISSLYPNQISLQSIGGGVLPKLQSLSGYPANISSLVPGRPVRHISIPSHQPISLVERGYIDLPGDSLVTVRSLTLDKAKGVSDEILQQLGSVFTNLSSLCVCLDEMTVSDTEISVDLIIKFLPQWAHLQVCRLGTAWGRENIMRRYPRFPLSSDSDPIHRGHPSLRELCFDDHFALGELYFEKHLAWLWFPGEGWSFREF